VHASIASQEIATEPLEFSRTCAVENRCPEVHGRNTEYRNQEPGQDDSDQNDCAKDIRKR
jgi:hypothetical protein